MWPDPVFLRKKLAVGETDCHQPRALDVRARSGRRLEKVPPAVMADVLARLATIFR
ncbi:type II toxin-antitoxin system PemK/MazF family toxin [Desulfovibrio sp. OH1186_COT-070]|uniref:type II toxin-antitoxin system PemK/MazF family toxin n=1 Tax=unclassified Desulfovibrio TaxID=2593640 RepID=UPI0039089BDD